jgi:glycosyltransferase involved in cell wall biosynthesis
VSQADLYKHQWKVVRAIAALRSKGYDITLQLVGGGRGRPEALLQSELARSDPAGDYVSRAGFVPQSELPLFFDRSDIFIFASSCENMPNTLIEGMASGLPIASSDRGPMPEVLGDSGVYFDPEDSESIASAIERLVCDGSLRESISAKAIKRAEEFSWERCADETWAFLRDTVTILRGNEVPGPDR